MKIVPPCSCRSAWAPQPRIWCPVPAVWKDSSSNDLCNGHRKNKNHKFCPKKSDVNLGIMSALRKRVAKSECIKTIPTNHLHALKYFPWQNQFLGVLTYLSMKTTERLMIPVKFLFDMHFFACCSNCVSPLGFVKFALKEHFWTQKKGRGRII